MAALVAIMITIAISTADINGLKNIRKIPKSDTAVMLMTFAVTMLQNLIILHLELLQELH